jgi:beta-fructofuranosidase
VGRPKAKATLSLAAELAARRSMHGGIRKEGIMQYWAPEDRAHFVGDCMPFYHDGIWHLFYLLDEGHHQGLGGLGGHQWAHASTRDLIYWEHHPLALPLTAEWEGSICTGSVFYHDGVYHAFYATRKRDRSQHLSHAVSTDGATFQKCEPNPFASPSAPYNRDDYRDPFVFAGDDGRFHMLVTTQINDFPVRDRGGCLLRLSSYDLWQWKVEGPFLIPGDGRGPQGVPECPDYFHWNGWYYLLFGLGLQTHYRMSRGPFGPWIRPRVDVLDGAMCAVMKTAALGPERRIGAAWIGARQGNRDAGKRLWGGNALLREIIQRADGTLGTRFPAEMIPHNSEMLAPSFTALTSEARGSEREIELQAFEGVEVGALDGLPQDLHIRCMVRPGEGTSRFGLGLRGAGRYESGYELCLDLHRGLISLAGASVPAAVDLRVPFSLEVIARGDILDVCVGDRQCIVNRCPELRGERLFVFCHCGSVRLDAIDVRAL